MKCQALTFIHETLNRSSSIADFIVKNDGQKLEPSDVQTNIEKALESFQRTINLWGHSGKKVDRVHVFVEHKLREIVITITWAKTKHKNPIDAFESRDVLLYMTSKERDPS